MLNTQILLLPHHGTAGAMQAEKLAFELATPQQTLIVHLLVVPDLWDGMQGDDWLNNASTRDTFGRYVEGLLEKDAADQLRALEGRCREHNLAYKSIVRVGDPTECIIEAAAQEHATLAVVGPPRPKGMLGIRSGIQLEPLVRKLKIPLLIANAET
jgi:nucleotide-binding universal stress UspA family protein